jgi:type IV pilus assembly protein PilM
MFNNTVTLYIDETSIRLLSTGKKGIEKFDYIGLEPGLIKGSTIVKEAEVAEKIKLLVKKVNVGSKKITLGFSGLHSLTRPISLPVLPKAMLPEAIAREARRVLPVPLDQLYLSWKVLSANKGKTQAFVAATQRKTADSLVKTVRNAGLDPHRMMIKPLALSRMIKAKEGILIDVQPSEFDIVIFIDGIPQPVRTVSMPTETLTWEQKATMIANDLERTINFFNTNNPENPLKEKVPVFVSGDFLQRKELHEQLSGESGHPVKPLPVDMELPEKFDIPKYIVNIGLALKHQGKEIENQYPLADLNILPVPYQPKPISLNRIIGIPACAAIVAILIPTIFMLQANSATIESKEIELQNIRIDINKKNTEKVELQNNIKKLEEQKTSVEQTYNNFKRTHDTIDTRQEYINNDLQLLIVKLPDDITLKSINDTDSALILKGTAPHQEDVHEYAQTILNYALEMDMSLRFSETNITSLKITDGEQPEGEGESGEESDPTGQIDFTLTFTRGDN